MKNRIYIITFIAFFLGMQSCTKDFLVLEPKTGLVEDNYYKTESDAFLALTSVYDALSVQNWQFVPIMSDIFSDDAFSGGSDAGDMRQWQEIEQGTLDAENDAAKALWNRCYTGIYRANLYLEKQEQIEWKTDGLKARYEAEAKFLRAYFYWDLARHFGWVPIITEVLPSVEDYKSLEQSTPDQVFAQVVSDLTDAESVLPMSVGDNDKGRATKAAVYVLESRVYLFYEGFAKPVLGASTNLAIDKAHVVAGLESIINSGEYSLLPNYADVFDWANENNNETIFSWQYSEKAKSGDWSGWNINGNFSVIFYGIRNPEGDPSIETGWSFATVSWDLVNEFEANDPRKDVSIYDADTKLTKYTKAFQNTGYFNYKYMPRSAYHSAAGQLEHNYPINYKDMRYADVLLMAAELKLNDDPVKALDYLNQVRTRALGSSAALSSITLDAIYHERRVEFAGEGKRKWDLMRRGLDYMESQINSSFVVGNITNAQDFQNRNFNRDTWGMFPIPGSEIRNMNSGTLKQYVPAYK